MLCSHPGLEWDGELFHEYHERVDRSATIDAFQELKKRIRTTKFQNYGFETKFQHLDSNGLELKLEQFLLKLRDLEFDHCILLRRRNYLRQALSVARGQLSGQWHVSAHQDQNDAAPFRLDVEKVSLGGRNRTLLECFEFLDATYLEAVRSFERTGLSFREIVYEDHLEEDPRIGCELALDYLELAMHEPKITLKKLESRPMNQIVSNFDSIEEVLKDTPYQWMCSK